MSQYYPQALKPLLNMKHIPPNKFIDIDEKFYRPKPQALLEQESFGNQRTILPYGMNRNYQSTTLLQKPMGLAGNNFNVNYGSYIYNPQVGFQ